MMMSLFITFSTSSFAATRAPQNPLLVESVLNVAFATPDYQGIYKFQVYINGQVQKIDNKGNVTRLAMLSEGIIQKISKTIDTIPTDIVVSTPDTPPCMDAPSTENSVYSTQGTKILIRTVYGCREGLSNNESANEIVRWLKHLQAALDIDFSTPGLRLNMLLGQEGYGNPVFEGPDKTLICEDKYPIGDDGFALSVEQNSDAKNDYKMIIERSLLTGPKTETYDVSKNVSTRPGDSVHYVNSDKTIILDVLMTGTPQPDDTFVGHFQKIGAGGTEVRELLCKFKAN